MNSNLIWIFYWTGPYLLRLSGKGRFVQHLQPGTLLTLLHCEEIWNIGECLSTMARYVTIHSYTNIITFGYKVFTNTGLQRRSDESPVPCLRSLAWVRLSPGETGLLRGPTRTEPRRRVRNWRRSGEETVRPRPKQSSYDFKLCRKF